MFFTGDWFSGLYAAKTADQSWGAGYYFFRQRSDVELIFLNLLCQLYTADRHGRRLESLESEHRPDSLFYQAMILLDYVVQVFRGANPYLAR